MTGIELHNETRLNVASLLMEDSGAFREVRVILDTFRLDDDLSAHDVSATVRLTHVQGGVFANGSLAGAVELECTRCLNPYDQPFSTPFAEEYRQTVEVRSGQGVPVMPGADPDEDDDDLAFEINDAHELDLGEMFRQYILLELPMRADCGPDCPGMPEYAHDEPETERHPFAALQDLLSDE